MTCDIFLIFGICIYRVSGLPEVFLMKCDFQQNPRWSPAAILKLFSPYLSKNDYIRILHTYRYWSIYRVELSYCEIHDGNGCQMEDLQNAVVQSQFAITLTKLTRSTFGDCDFWQNSRWQLDAIFKTAFAYENGMIFSQPWQRSAPSPVLSCLFLAAAVFCLFLISFCTLLILWILL